MTVTSRLTRHADGCLTTHLARIAPSAKAKLRPVLSNGSIVGRESVSAMARRTNALVMVNGSYFHTTGEIIGLMKLGGEIVSADSSVRSALGITKDGQYRFGRAAYQGIITLPDGRQVSVSAVNRERGDDMCIVYRPSFGKHTGTNAYGTEYIVRDGRITAITDGSSPLAQGTLVISAHGKACDALANLRIGDTVTVSETLSDGWAAAEHILGAGPALITGGAVQITAREEGFGADVAGGRAPRTAVGITQDGTLLLAVAEGRHELSRGITLGELAEWLRAEGAVEAINLDGGGSSVMWAGGALISTPSDKTERLVGNALGIFVEK